MVVVDFPCAFFGFTNDFTNTNEKSNYEKYSNCEGESYKKSFHYIKVMIKKIPKKRPSRNAMKWSEDSD